MTLEQRRALLAICICVGLTFLVSAGLAFLIQPVSEDLGISDAGVEVVLSIPSIASLVVIFIAGQTGDQLGHRRTLLLLSGLFTAGSLLLASAQEIVGVIGGLALCGGAGTAIQIVALGLLQESIPEGRARVSAFTTFGTVYPLALIVVPVLTAALLDAAVWRLVPLGWAAAGLVMFGVVAFLVRRTSAPRQFGEWLTLLLAGIALAAGVRFLDSMGRKGISAPGTFAALVVLIVALIAFAVRFRVVVAPGFSFEPIRGPMIRALLLGVAVVSLVGAVTYIIVALEYMYGMSPLKAAIAVIPAQIGAILGAKMIAGAAMNRLGVTTAGRHLLLVLAIAQLPLVGMQADSPAWYLVVCATLLLTSAFAAITVLNADVMSYAPPGRTGPVSAVRGAASAIGAGLGVVVIGTSVITAVNVSGGEAHVGAEQIRQLAWGLRLDGILGCAVVLVAWLALTIVERTSVPPVSAKG